MIQAIDRTGQVWLCADVLILVVKSSPHSADRLVAVHGVLMLDSFIDSMLAQPKRYYEEHTHWPWEQTPSLYKRIL